MTIHLSSIAICPLNVSNSKLAGVVALYSICAIYYPSPRTKDGVSHQSNNRNDPPASIVVAGQDVKTSFFFFIVANTQKACQCCASKNNCFGEVLEPISMEARRGKLKARLEALNEQYAEYESSCALLTYEISL